MKRTKPKSKNQAYTVFRGHRQGVFENWDEVAPLVHSYPGALFKGYPSTAKAKMDFDRFLANNKAIGETKKDLANRAEVTVAITEATLVQIPNNLKHFLWSAKQVCGRDSGHKKVFPVETLVRAYTLSSIQHKIDLYKLWSSIFANAEETIASLNQQLKEELEVEYHTLFFRKFTTDFDVNSYLRYSILRAYQYREHKGERALCYPEDDFDLIEPFFSLPHQNAFYKKHPNVTDKAFLSKSADVYNEYMALKKSLRLINR